ncbi:type VII secretion protein EssC, partial [Listeria monocytogenes]|nr:type VII secretion protein EssC [Listeria monocytogenes]
FMETIIQNSMNEYEERRKVVTRLREENRTRIEIEEQLANMPEILLFITDLSSVIESVEAKYLDMLEKMLGDAAVYKVFFTIGASLGSLSGYDSLSKTVKAMKNVLLFTDVKQQSVINVVSKSGILKPLKPFEAYYIDNKIYSKVKVAYVKEEE